eukprot:CAMPEP_0181224254 /NCGR_PEP_ID=MMETSP1096-20121128/31018_1 /TAXON_ID=156174 ORGANISM="Chrysochromulina ericina, Strain CCMP281" /NCGR_SAMPLE_ID=MMETSP1096 /ASSEMBLY_ACC=CAM_ASM_000453 /LENGTH=168 /DNA_ID=CAMNT_0023317303 /DNA_START=243 /DNA_END=750 /DNA_ORIENTATION=-
MAGAADQTRMREKLSPLAEHKSHNEDTQEARELVCCGACRTRGLRELRRVRISAGSLPGLCHAHAVRAHTITTHHVGPSAGINKPPLMCVGFRVIGLSCAANQIAMNPELTALLSITGASRCGLSSAMYALRGLAFSRLATITDVPMLLMLRRAHPGEAALSSTMPRT